MTYFKLERLAGKLKSRIDEEWKKIEYLDVIKKKDEFDDWPEFDGDDYFTQLQFYKECMDNLNVCFNILHLADEKISSTAILLNTEREKLQNLEKVVDNTRNRLKITKDEYGVRFDYTKLIELYEKQRQLVGELDESLFSLKISTNVEVPEDLDIFLSRYAN